MFPSALCRLQDFSKYNFFPFFCCSKIYITIYFLNFSLWNSFRLQKEYRVCVSPSLIFLQCLPLKQPSCQNWEVSLGVVLFTELQASLGLYWSYRLRPAQFCAAAGRAVSVVSSEPLQFLHLSLSLLVLLKSTGQLFCGIPSIQISLMFSC